METKFWPRFWLVDAFTTEPFCGNPAGVCLVEDFPPDAFMQNIAAEFNWSETAFVQPKGRTHFHIRWFSPRDEAPLCGHATLAAAHILWQEGWTDSPSLTFDSLGGTLRATKHNEWIQLEFPARFMQDCPIPHFLEEALYPAKICSIMRDDWVYLVRLETEEIVENLTPNLSLIEKIPCRAIIVTAKGAGEYDFVSRYFAPRVGIPEDPVCGSAHCRLAPFWMPFLRKNKFLVRQSSQRGGILKVELREERVLISGQAVSICTGNFLPYRSLRQDAA